MSTIRLAASVSPSQPTLEGAGVRLRRAFGFNRKPGLDPFLLLDEFHSHKPGDYIRGFPWQPHCGIETITYMLRGRVAHGDSMGNAGGVAAGDVQWMTAGSGIIHQEMPEGDETSEMWSLQLWANLPAASRMMAPRYQESKAGGIPALQLAGGAAVRVVCGELGGTRGPVQDIMTDPAYLDVQLPAGSAFRRELPAGHNVFVYVFQGALYPDDGGARLAGALELAPGMRARARGTRQTAPIAPPL